jgi:hypothetical protein
VSVYRKCEKAGSHYEYSDNNRLCHCRAMETCLSTILATVIAAAATITAVVPLAAAENAPPTLPTIEEVQTLPPYVKAAAYVIAIEKYCFVDDRPAPPERASIMAAGARQQTLFTAVGVANADDLATETRTALQHLMHDQSACAPAMAYVERLAARLPDADLDAMMARNAAYQAAERAKKEGAARLAAEKLARDNRCKQVTNRAEAALPAAEQSLAHLDEVAAPLLDCRPEANRVLGKIETRRAELRAAVGNRKAECNRTVGMARDKLANNARYAELKLMVPFITGCLETLDGDDRASAQDALDKIASTK